MARITFESVNSQRIRLGHKPMTREAFQSMQGEEDKIIDLLVSVAKPGTEWKMLQTLLRRIGKENAR
jgi:hypothetical protein